ncbi:hypothetical protein ABID29_002470 [Streptococcus rupicaprae]|uniref:HNH nuclease domain-containing protein n=1 Tax=Streptococcus rupicaprae TaxID=759619 RepID=A0ABV2FL93_9STRE
MEIWKTVKGYEGLYEVSNLGRVKSLDKIVPKWDGVRLLKGRILKGSVTQFGYHKVILTKNKHRRTIFVHRLVAEAFLENDNPKIKTQVNHIDGDKLNNETGNLEWVSASENIKHAFSIGIKKVSKKQTEAIKNLGENSNKRVLQLNPEGQIIQEWHSITEASKILNINMSSISMCCHGKRNLAGGFKWKYINNGGK